MQHETGWILDALAQDPAKTRTGLAKALGIDKSGVTRLLQGERRLKYEEARKAAAYLGVAPGGGFAEDDAPFAPETGALTAPLYAAAPAADGLWRLDRSAVIERRPRAPHFAGAEAAFGFYAPDDAHAPRFHAGEIVWINPARPAAAGNDALLIGRDGEATLADIYLGVLEKLDANSLYAHQYGGGKKTRRFLAPAWRAAYVYGRE